MRKTNFEIGRRLRELREARLIDIDDLARAVGEPAQQLLQMEAGKAIPAGLLVRLCDHLNVSLEAFFKVTRSESLTRPRRPPPPGLPVSQKPQRHR